MDFVTVLLLTGLFMLIGLELLAQYWERVRPVDFTKDQWEYNWNVQYWELKLPRTRGFTLVEVKNSRGNAVYLDVLHQDDVLILRSFRPFTGTVTIT